jgi:23S rRNA (adenine2503-C2)-methyltransferase
MMAEGRPDILTLTAGELARWLEDMGGPSYRLDQLLEWLYVKRAGSFEEMTNLSRALRRTLEESFALCPLRVVDAARSRDGSTEKLLLEARDGEHVECVSMAERPHATFCVSSQAGCALGCRFCATGQAGFARNLTSAEMLGQVWLLARQKGWPANVVFMGMGEPLMNLDALLPALDALTDRQRFALGSRRITVSTAGVTPGIRALSLSPARPCLALSLNSPFDAQRSELMPVNRRCPLAEVVEACREYHEATGRRLLLEYVLLGGVNTSISAARATAELARKLGALVNLIPFNTVPGCGFQPPEHEEVRRFRDILEVAGVSVTQRFRRGRDIAAGCGQLKGRHAAGACAGPEPQPARDERHE